MMMMTMMMIMCNDIMCTYNLTSLA